MNTSTFKEVFTASIKVFPYCDIILFNSFVDFLIVCCVKYGWINLWLSFQYLVERIHTNYALQVRTAHVLCLSNEIMMVRSVYYYNLKIISVYLLNLQWYQWLFHFFCQIIPNSFLANPNTSATFATILVRFLLDRLDEMGSKLLFCRGQSSQESA